MDLTVDGFVDTSGDTGTANTNGGSGGSGTGMMTLYVQDEVAAKTNTCQLKMGDRAGGVWTGSYRY